MGTMQMLTISGTAATDGDLAYTEEGTARLKFVLKLTEYQGKDTPELATFFKVYLYGKRAESFKVKRDDGITVSNASLINSEPEVGENGQAKFYPELVVGFTGRVDYGLVKGLNSIMVSGQLGRDSEVRALSNTHVMNLNIATGDRDAETVWFRATMWDKEGKRANGLAPYLNKGDGVIIMGRYGYNLWNGKDGKLNVDHQVTVNDLRFPPYSRSTNDGYANAGDTEQAGQPQAQNDDFWGASSSEPKAPVENGAPIAPTGW